MRKFLIAAAVLIAGLLSGCQPSFGPPPQYPMAPPAPFAPPAHLEAK